GLQRFRKADELRCGESLEQSAAGSGRIEQALAPIGASSPLHDIALVDELFQHAAKALLGDLQDVEQIGDPQARMSGDEVQYAMMGAAEAEVPQNRVGVAGEVAIGEEQQFGVGQQLSVGAAQGLALGSRACAPLGVQRFRQRVIYVSHVDL